MDLVDEFLHVLLVFASLGRQLDLGLWLDKPYLLIVINILVDVGVVLVVIVFHLLLRWVLHLRHLPLTRGRLRIWLFLERSLQRLVRYHLKALIIVKQPERRRVNDFLELVVVW